VKFKPEKPISIVYLHYNLHISPKSSNTTKKGEFRRRKESKDLSREDLPPTIWVPSLERFRVNFYCNFLNSLLW
jgi:hypothetical protein